MASVTTTIRLSADEKEALKLRAGKAGISMGALLKAVALRQPIRHVTTQKADPAIVRQLSGIGNNLNQITRQIQTANMRKEYPLAGQNAARLYSALVDIHEEMQSLL